MPVQAFQYFSQAKANDPPRPEIARTGCDAVRQALSATECIALCYGGYLTIFFYSQREPDPATIAPALIEAGCLPVDQQFEFKSLSGIEAVRRFLLLACGMTTIDSGINVLEMLHRAYRDANSSGYIGPVFRRLFHRGIWLHEKVRQESAFFRFAVDAPSVFGELAEKIIGKLGDVTVCAVGESSELPAFMEALHHHKAQSFILYSRPSEVAAGATERFRAEHRRHSEFHGLPSAAQIVLVCSSIPRIDEEMIRKRMKENPHQPLIVLDMAASDIHSRSLKRINNLYIYRMADIHNVMTANRLDRSEATSEAETWVDLEVLDLCNWFENGCPGEFYGIIGQNEQMERLYEMISRISRTDITVLIEGESGTGKELVARAIHDLSARADRPFKVINCGAIPENLLESELFGHVRGAFTGAIASKQGLFEAANNGTILLDEVAELPSQLQVKLLRALQEGEIKRVGSNETSRVNVRLLAATNMDLGRLVKLGTFRGDLYYRLNVIQLTLPPLRSRHGDIPLLLKHFLKKFAVKLRKNVTDIDEDALRIIEAHDWPGNIRELENAIERAVALAFSTTITSAELPAHLSGTSDASPAAGTQPQTPPITLKEMERHHIMNTLAACDWNYDQASKQLGIGRTTLWRKLREYKVVAPEN